MAEINQDTIESKLKPFTDKFGKETYDEIREKYQLDEIKNIFISYSNFLAINLSSKEEAKQFALWWNEENVKYSGIPLLGIFKTQFNRGFKTWLKSQEKTINDFQELDENHHVSKSENVNTETPSQIEKIDNMNDILNALANDDSQSMLMAEIMKIEGILQKQLNTKTEKKATYEQVKKVLNELHLVKERLFLKTDEEKEVEQLESKERNKLFLIGFGVGVIVILALIGIIGLFKVM